MHFRQLNVAISIHAGCREQVVLRRFFHPYPELFAYIRRQIYVLEADTRLAGHLQPFY